MAQAVREIMTRDPVVMEERSTVAEAARAMKEQDIGDVIVTAGEQVCGIVTDRDIVVRALAEGREPMTTKLADIVSSELVTVKPDDPVEEAARLMRQRALRRMPVVSDGRPVGVVSIGDLAIERDEESGLAQISAARANR
jgi:CBS domain-containing protein